MSHLRGKGQDKPSQIFAECMSPSSCRSDGHSHSDVKLKVESDATDNSDRTKMKLEVYHHQIRNLNLEPTPNREMHQKLGGNFGQGQLQPPQPQVQPNLQWQQFQRPTVVVPLRRAMRSATATAGCQPTWFQPPIDLEMNSTTGIIQLWKNNMLADFRPIHARGITQAMKWYPSPHFSTEAAIEVDAVTYFIRFSNATDKKNCGDEYFFCR